ncbi:MAG: hypothetical protein ACI81Q_001449 [Paracoccaceae bacterium]|jgi:hypothetical protein
MGVFCTDLDRQGAVRGHMLRASRLALPGSRSTLRGLVTTQASTATYHPKNGVSGSCVYAVVIRGYILVRRIFLPDDFSRLRCLWLGAYREG